MLISISSYFIHGLSGYLYVSCSW